MKLQFFWSRTASIWIALLYIILGLPLLLSAAAFWRMEERSRGSVPSNYLEYMLDTWYGDQAMQQRYQNMELPHSVS